MKKLIDVAAVNAMKAEGKTTVYVDGDTLITPAARDAISSGGMTIQEGSCPVPETTLSASCCQKSGEAGAPAGEVDPELIYRVLLHMQKNGRLQELLDACSPERRAYQAEYDAAGFKLVRGGSIRTEILDTGDPAQNGKVRYREIIGKEDGSSMSAGMITIDDVEFGWETECQEIYHIISGCITVTIDGKTYEAAPGDSFFVKKGVKCSFGAKGTGKAFYATY